MKEVEEIIRIKPELADCHSSIRKAGELLITRFKKGSKVLLCGNGGSSADCEHISGELVKRFSRPRSLPPDVRNALGPELSKELHGGLPALSLPSMIGFHTAFANDDNPVFAFAQQVVAFGKPGDVLLGISTSGNSKNVIHAARTAKALKMVVISLTGKNGGELAPLSDVAVKAPADEVPRIQELHLPIYHTLCEMVENALFS